MEAAAVRSAPLAEAVDPGRRAAALVRDCSIEIAPQDGFAGPSLRDVLDPGRTVFINHPATATHHAIIAAAARLRRAGFMPVPHVAARRLLGFTQARDFLCRAGGEAGVEEVLLIGGDPGRPLGAFDSALDLLASGVVERCGIRRVAFAGYPDGHPQISNQALGSALQAKLALARQVGLEAEILTQFGFDAGSIHRWIDAQRARGVNCPIRIGLAGPANVATLAQFAVRCGVGSSLRALARGHTAFARILAEVGPESLVRSLVATETPASPIDALHIFAFGGIRRTATWLRNASA
jgi:methylenetetrahydrofolate reductase (NADPH)